MSIQEIEIFKDKLYFAYLDEIPKNLVDNAHFFSIENVLIYQPFVHDFGPFHLGHVFRFCNLLEEKLHLLQSRESIFIAIKKERISLTPVFLLCSYLMIHFKQSPIDSFKSFESLQTLFIPFRDAAPTCCSFDITILDCLYGLEKAIELNFFDLTTFNVFEYEYYEKVENGDLNWIIPGRLLAFAGPHSVAFTSQGRVYTPEDYIPLFKKIGVSAVARLNRSDYEPDRFIRHGIDHYDFFFPDGSAPTKEIVQNFLQMAENHEGVIAVHCRAGLGRTGTLLAAYIMKHYGFSAKEAISWIRICRPGSIIGPQQYFLEDIQMQLWGEGDVFRKKKKLSQKTVSFESVRTEFKGIQIKPQSITHTYTLRNRTIVAFYSNRRRVSAKTL